MSSCYVPGSTTSMRCLAPASCLRAWAASIELDGTRTAVGASIGISIFRLTVRHPRHS